MKKTIITIIAILGCVYANAQDSQSNFFLDNYSYSYRYNPALMCEKSFFSAGVGNINSSMSSTLGLSSLLYPKGDQLVTAFNKNVSSEEFLSNLKESNTLGAGLDVNLLALGIRSNKGMFTLEINEKTDMQANLPRDLFAFLKNGSSDTPYNLSKLGMYANSYAEAVFGYTRSILDGKMNIGVRAKYLAGVASVQVNTVNSQLVSNAAELGMSLEGQVLISGPFDLGKAGETVDFSKITVNTNNIKPVGHGFGLDLGMTYDITKNLRVSAAITNLGFMNWEYSYVGKVSGDIDFKGFNGLDLNNAEASLNAEVDEIKGQLENLTKITRTDGTQTITNGLPYTVNAGVRYKLPVVRFISVGATGAYHSESMVKWYEARAGVTLTPLGWLSASGNVGTSTFGPVAGVRASITLLCFNIYAGLDATLGKYGTYNNSGTKLQYPVDGFRYNAQLGLTLQFGKRRSW